MACTPTLKYPIPIRPSFERTISIGFSAKNELGQKIYLDLSLYNILFGVKLGKHSPQAEVVYPTISTPSPSSGWVFFTFSESQTLLMKAGIWYGNILLKNTSTKKISHSFNIEICVEECISLP